MNKRNQVTFPPCSQEHSLHLHLIHNFPQQNTVCCNNKHLKPPFFPSETWVPSTSESRPLPFHITLLSSTGAFYLPPPLLPLLSQSTHCVPALPAPPAPPALSPQPYLRQEIPQQLQKPITAGCPRATLHHNPVRQQLQETWCPKARSSPASWCTHPAL